MQNFREAVKTALKSAAVDEETATRWDDVLRDFAAGINEEEPAVFAFVRLGGAPTVRHLVLVPKGRRDQSAILLSAAATPNVIVILSGLPDERREFTEVDAFQAFLLGFARLPTFRETLETLRKIAAEPVTGFLRFGHHKNRMPSRDIVVKVPADAQQALADAAEATPRRLVEMPVAPTGPSPLGQGTYDASHPPRWLVAGGYVLEIEQGDLQPDGWIKLRGTPLDPQATQ